MFRFRQALKIASRLEARLEKLFSGSAPDMHPVPIKTRVRSNKSTVQRQSLVRRRKYRLADTAGGNMKTTWF